MIVKLQFESNHGGRCDRTEAGDAIIRAIDERLGGASWESSGTGWIARA
jgi:hypothetical protein|tara:strand:- start:3946 stop:4092 length:147 start_codon:yes stop_codon:yes gene_type:complete